MKKEHRKFIKKLRTFLQKNPEQRITQALFNLGVSVKAEHHLLPQDKAYFIDNYNQDDELTLERVNESLKNIKKDGKRKEKSQA